MASNSRSSWKRWLPGIVVSSIIIAVLFTLVDLDSMRSALLNIQWGIALVAMLLLALANLARAAAWRGLLGKKIGLLDTFYIVNEGYLLNQIIPRSGEIGRALLVNSVHPMNFFQAISTIAIERAFDLLLAALMFLATIGRVVAMDWITPIAVAVLVVVLAGFVFLFWAIKKKDVVVGWCSRMDERFAFFKRFISPNLKAILDGAQVIQKGSALISTLFWIVVCWALWMSVSYILLLGFVDQFPLWWVVFMQAVLAFGIALPSAPAGLGVFEGTIVAALAVLQVENEIALSFAIVMHIVQLLTIGLLGIISLLMQGNSLRDLLDRVVERLRVKRSANEE